MTPVPSAAIDLKPADFHGVTLVGGGPGDPELITVAGLRALLAADVVVTDRLAPRELLAGLEPGVEIIDVAKIPRGAFTPQEDINALLIDRARRGGNVVRLKGGDNYVFGRGFEEVLALQAADVPVRVIPGLSSAISVPAIAGIPVTHRGVVHGFTVVSGHVPPGHSDSLVNWDSLAQSNGTLVVLMGVENAGAIASRLIAAGRPDDEPVAVIADGSLPGERVHRTTLGQLDQVVRDESVEPPAIIIVGAVVAIGPNRESS